MDVGKSEEGDGFFGGMFGADGSQRVWDQPLCEVGMSFEVADECLGTHHMDSPFVRNTSTFMMQETAPGLGDRPYSATFPRQPAIDEPFMLKFAAHFKEADQLDGIRQSLKKLSGPNTEAGILAWISLLSDDPNFEGGHIFQKLPTTGFYPDLGLSFMRESWRDNAVAATFKCGPPGGYHYISWWQACRRRREVR